MSTPLGPDERVLFRAGRDERAPDALRAALLARARGTRTATAAREPPRITPPSARHSRLLACAALLGAGFAALLRLAPSEEPAPAISAERADAVPRASLPGDPTRAASEPAEVTSTAAQATLPESVAPPAARPRAESSRASGARPPARAPARPKESPPRTTAPRASPVPAPASAPAGSTPPHAAAPAASPTPRATFAEQLDVLARARAALRAGHAQSALEILDGHASTLRQNDLEAEGRLLHIEALASQGDSARARREAEEFVHDYPNSPLLERAQSFARSSR